MKCTTSFLKPSLNDNVKTDNECLLSSGWWMMVGLRQFKVSPRASQILQSFSGDLNNNNTWVYINDINGRE